MNELDTEQEILEVKDAYTALQSLKIVTEYGPLRAYAEPDKVQQIYSEVINPALTPVHKSSREINGTYVVEAPSPWHAFFYLRAQQHYLYRGGRPLYSEVKNGDQYLGEHLFFRGQRCASWEIKSSLRRKNQIEQAIEQRAVGALTEYFRSYFARDDDIATNTALCFAQHYGIATDLMDISCDPDMAVWFATHPVEKVCPNSESVGIVQAVSWAGQAQGTNTICLLPPPFVRNIYTQRGLFIDTSSTDGRLMSTTSLLVRFPRETSGGEFSVLRQGHSIKVWPELDAVESELISWARNIGANYTDGKDIVKTVQAHQNSDMLPKFWLERDLFDFDRLIVNWLSILDWVLPATCVTALPIESDGPTPMRYAVSKLKARFLICANPSLFKAFAKAAEDANFTGFEVLREVLSLARD